nr:MAG TPA: hypothetical protein [Caudoviricetes sp.]
MPIKIVSLLHNTKSAVYLVYEPLGVNFNLKVALLLSVLTIIDTTSSKDTNLPFTEVMITDVCRLAIKINQSKRAWCKSHALNLFI